MYNEAGYQWVMRGDVGLEGGEHVQQGCHGDDGVHPLLHPVAQVDVRQSQHVRAAGVGPVTGKH